MSVRLTNPRGSLENAVGTGRPRRRWNCAHFAGAVAGTLTALTGERGFERILRMIGRS
jgi:hypothetical protein